MLKGENMGINGIVERIAVRPDDLFYREHVARYELARKYVDHGPLLDIACGSGYGSEMLQDACEAMVVGIDIDQTAVAAAKQAFSNPQIVFMVGTGTALPFQPDSFLTITSMETLEHIEDDRGFLGELSRVLRPEGTCIISTPNQMHSLTHRVTNPYHVREYSEDQLKNLLSSFFQSIQVFYQGFDDSYHETVQNYAETI